MKLRYFKNMNKKFDILGIILPWADEIHLEINLKKYPGLQQFIINHEREHQKVIDNYGYFSIRGLWIHRWIDLKDRIISMLKFKKQLKNLSKYP